MQAAASVQSVVPAGHLPQAPATQACPVSHAVPHAPQLDGLVCRFTQAPPRPIGSRGS